MLSMKTVLGLDLQGGIELVYQGEPTPQTPKVTQQALDDAVTIMRNRVDPLGGAEPSIQTSGGNQISVGLPNVKDTNRAKAQVGNTARLEFYDWEANVLTPKGRAAADLLQQQDPAALALSRGTPGSPGGGSMSLYDAVKLASKQPPQPGNDNARKGSEYYLF